MPKDLPTRKFHPSLAEGDRHPDCDNTPNKEHRLMSKHETSPQKKPPTALPSDSWLTPMRTVLIVAMRKARCRWIKILRRSQIRLRRPHPNFPTQHSFNGRDVACVMWRGDRDASRTPSGKGQRGVVAVYLTKATGVLQRGLEMYGLLLLQVARVFG